MMRSDTGCMSKIFFARRLRRTAEMPCLCGPEAAPWSCGAIECPCGLLYCCGRLAILGERQCQRSYGASKCR
eukprot:1978172-Pyramimonas_sp.AAC.1